MEEDPRPPAPAGPFEPPPLPRGLLAARAAALEEKRNELRRDNAREEDVKKVEARLSATREMLRKAGGETERKMHFGILDLDRKMARTTAAIERAEKELAEAESGVLEAIDRRDRAAADLQPEKAKLGHIRDHRAHLALQAAVEANAHAEKYAFMYQAMQDLQNMLQSEPGMEGRLDALQQVTSFLGSFVPAEYDASNDPMLHGITSDCEDGATTDVEQADHFDDAATFRMESPIVQAERDLLDLKQQAAEAAAGAVHAAAARAVDLVQGGGTRELGPSPASVFLQFGQRLQEAESRLDEAKARGASCSHRDYHLLQPPTSSTKDLPSAFATAEKASLVQAAPECGNIPSAFVRMSVGTICEPRYKPAVGGPRGRARSADNCDRARERSRSMGAAKPAAAAAADAKKQRTSVESQGDQVVAECK